MIPSYDDLTPGIPDVVDAENVDRLARFLHEDLHRRSGDHEKWTDKAPELLNSCLFACLRALDRSPDPPITKSPDPAIAKSSDALLAIARDFSPRVMRVSDGEVLLDVSGLGRLIGEPPDIARQLARAIDAAGLKASAAVAPTQIAARVMARAGTGGAWTNLPVGILRELEVLPPRINHRDRDRPYEIFAAWGIATLGDLAALPPGDLSSRLGRRGVALHRLSRGLDPAPFVPDAETPRYIGRLELEWPIDALEPLSFVFARLLDPLSAALERADRGAAAIRLELRLTDRSTHARLLQLPAAMRDARVLRTLLLLDLESAPPSAAVDIVTIELDPAPARITQFSLLQRALPSPETLSTLTARLGALVGDARIGSPVLLDSHRPDAFVMERYAPQGARDGADGADRAAGATGAVLRRQRGSVALRVSVEHGRPVHIASSRRGVPCGAIAQAAGPWRTSGGWWTDDSWNRNEWDVALTSGTVCRIVQNRADSRWFLEGVYD